MIEIKGYRKFTESRGGGEHGYCDMEQYEIFFIENGVKKIAKLDNNYGDCYSGYTSATRGDMEIRNVNEFGTIHFIPIGKIEIDGIYDFVDISDGGGDDYYPSGYAKIKDKYINMFKQTSRFKENRQVYLFIGKSGAGKSYIANNTNLEVYETDRSSSLPQFINVSIVVIGNKYKFELDDIKERCGNDVDFVYVNFNC